MGWKEYILERFRIKERNVSVADRKAEDIWMSRVKISYDNGGNEHGVLNGDSMNGKWISCDDLLPSPSYKGLNGFVLCYTEGRVAWGRYTSNVWYGIDGMPIWVSAWYDANYIGLIKGI